ncbi:hypothetical protein [Phenylobacterium sp.]|uniref:hypothetical protein n=1 Tax=Phenylobacterium sp. TaxID=1871053 RepID=UPI0025FC0D0D|nr:hypothetical protein [Phenylobacterium sp.]MCA6311560.1 hypothetical protein [Phenylobacterium sp.]MCA6339037.1 hypothetical protein [Phenylobacterium sp.]MCA6348945.1 hypothetical protein [Phenylobacterium sp.]MCA6351787.1 hypothetical protein [Phenylobacterium sp.]MCA6361340.1 hypothetical protein [Phenylobacterium sp.]
MNRRAHALAARRLIAACGGLVEAAAACRVGKTQLADYQAADGVGFMPADVMADLEAYCGTPTYSRMLVEARPCGPDTQDLAREACDAAEAAGRLQRGARLAADDGDLSERERRELAKIYAEALEQLRQVGDLLSQKVTP